MSQYYAIAPVEPSPLESEEAEDAPVKVVAAMHFVALCNEYMGLHGFPAEFEGVKVYDQKLHPAQEDAFYRACLLLSRYFDQDQGGEDGQDAPGVEEESVSKGRQAAHGARDVRGPDASGGKG